MSAAPALGLGCTGLEVRSYLHVWWPIARLSPSIVSVARDDLPTVARMARVRVLGVPVFAVKPADAVDGAGEYDWVLTCRVAVQRNPDAKPLPNRQRRWVPAGPVASL